MSTALVIGASGQDGSYMCEHLLKRGYSVHATYRPNGKLRLDATHGAIGWPLDLQESVDKLSWLLAKVQPNEIYNLAGQTFQPSSWASPSYTMDVNASFLMRLIEAIQKACPGVRLFHASAAGMYGSAAGSCNEQTPFDPRTPYDVAKLAAHKLCKIYREKGMFICTGILFSHESPRRGVEMVSRKISLAVAHWAVGNNSYPLTLGGTDFTKDWGWAPDFVWAMHRMLQCNEPRDFVLGSGEIHSIKDFLHATFEAGGISGHIEDRVKIVLGDRRGHAFCGYADSSLAQATFGFQPKRTPFTEIARRMVEADVERLKAEGGAGVRAQETSSV